MSKGLEEIKTLRTLNQRYFDNDKNVNNSYDIIEKELKALEIIKNKRVDVYDLMGEACCDNVNSFNYGLLEEFCLTQQEFDLLKEVLNYE